VLYLFKIHSPRNLKIGIYSSLSCENPNGDLLLGALSSCLRERVVETEIPELCLMGLIRLVKGSGRTGGRAGKLL